MKTILEELQDRLSTSRIKSSGYQIAIQLEDDCLSYIAETLEDIASIVRDLIEDNGEDALLEGVCKIPGRIEQKQVNINTNSLA